MRNSVVPAKRIGSAGTRFLVAHGSQNLFLVLHDDVQGFLIFLDLFLVFLDLVLVLDDKVQLVLLDFFLILQDDSLIVENRLGEFELE